MPLDYIIPIVHVLRFKAAGNDTVDYSYRFLRGHFTDIEAHKAMILSLMPGDPNITISPNQDFVDTGSAVAVYDDLTGKTCRSAGEELTRKRDSEELSNTTGPRASVTIALGTRNMRRGNVDG